MAYELTLDVYKGPLEKLLELVEGKKLEITLVSLACVTGEFMEYLKKLETEAKNHSLIADFLNIASKLLLIKSKILIPSLVLEDEEREEIKDLERRLKIYGEFKNAQVHLKKNWNILPQMASREFLMNLGQVFYPPEKFDKEKLRAALEKVFRELEKISKPKGSFKREIISIQEKIKEILKRLTEKPLSLTKLKGSGAKGELVVLFLAVLHLLKEELICAEQTGRFEDIKIAKSS